MLGLAGRALARPLRNTHLNRDEVCLLCVSTGALFGTSLWLFGIAFCKQLEFFFSGLGGTGGPVRCAAGARKNGFSRDIAGAGVGGSHVVNVFSEDKATVLVLMPKQGLAMEISSLENSVLGDGTSSCTDLSVWLLPFGSRVDRLSAFFMSCRGLSGNPASGEVRLPFSFTKESRNECTKSELADLLSRHIGTAIDELVGVQANEVGRGGGS